MLLYNMAKPRCTIRQHNFGLQLLSCWKHVCNTKWQTQKQKCFILFSEHEFPSKQRIKFKANPQLPKPIAGTYCGEYCTSCLQPKLDEKPIQDNRLMRFLPQVPTSSLKMLLSARAPVVWQGQTALRQSAWEADEKVCKMTKAAE